MSLFIKGVVLSSNLLVFEKEWYVGKAQKKSEREQELKSRFEQITRESVDKFQGVNLYVTNLDDNIDDDKLKELFSEFGTITSCKATEERYRNKGAYIVLEPPSFDTPFFHSFEAVAPRPKVNPYYDFEDIIDSDEKLDLVAMEPHSGVQQPAS